MDSRLLSSAWLEPFRSSPYSLRFELGGEATAAPIPRFLRALGRAREITDELFSASERVVGIVAAPTGEKADFFAPAADAFDALADAGFCGKLVSEWSGPLWPDQEAEEDQVPSRWRAFDLTGDTADRDVLLWCAVSYEMAILPKAPVLSFLADLDRGLLLHVYDDRGMDVTALDRQALTALYTNRADWLLPYDHERMIKVFGRPS